MRWDYFITIVDEMDRKIKRYDEELSQLENQLKESHGRERQQIRTSIASVKEELRKSYEHEVNNEDKDNVARAFAGCLVDDTTVWWFRKLKRKEDARTEIYMPIAQMLTVDEAGKVCDGLDFRPDFDKLPSSAWLGFQVDFELLTPWYSKDDRVFHVLDNPVRKDRVFGVPFMAASSWKGMLRWAFRMCTKLAGPEQETEEGKLKQAKAWELHLFGNEKAEGENFHQGAQVFYPTWFDRIGFEVINPHSRERRAGTQPIYYEVAPPGAKGTLSLLYAPWPGMEPVAEAEEVLPKLLEAIEALLTTYGISAKRTVGWGTAKILKWHAFHKTEGTVEKDNRADLEREVQAWLSAGGTP
ncbi:MAG TPA: RAMP superfamily CRISPR-associated protein [Chthonomonadales bacterium]|nr:RAMP superfamily CRISPR-associated protein [Chthonomonadales bacterium]